MLLDIGSSLLHGGLVQYADDTTLCFSAISSEVLEKQAFVDINNCVEYLQSFNLTTNTSKSNVLNFALRDVSNHCGPAVLFADSTLEEVLSSKFLGIRLDLGLTWNQHINHV
ncbi:hypothetical protein J6590_037143 [Homalodisca vitripennis]|nr:hypothetical protein J6590_037143 [Homalodisca vitripennis]